MSSDKKDPVNKGKVLDFNSKQKKSEKTSPEKYIATEFPPEITENLIKYNTLAVQLEGYINEALQKFSTKGEPMDISIPFDALNRAIGTLASEIDEQTLPESLEEHSKIRMELTEKLCQTVIQYAEEHQSTILSHDIYLAIVMTMNSFLHQHRVFNLLKQSLKKED